MTESKNICCVAPLDPSNDGSSSTNNTPQSNGPTINDNFNIFNGVCDGTVITVYECLDISNLADHVIFSISNEGDCDIDVIITFCGRPSVTRTVSKNNSARTLAAPDNGSYVSFDLVKPVIIQVKCKSEN